MSVSKSLKNLLLFQQDVLEQNQKVFDRALQQNEQIWESLDQAIEWMDSQSQAQMELAESAIQRHNEWWEDAEQRWEALFEESQNLAIQQIQDLNELHKLTLNVVSRGVRETTDTMAETQEELLNEVEESLSVSVVEPSLEGNGKEGIHSEGPEAVSELVDEEQPENDPRQSTSTSTATEPATVEHEEALQELQSIKGIGPSFAESLVELGVTSIDQLAEWSAEELASALDIQPWRTEPWIEQAREQK